LAQKGSAVHRNPVGPPFSVTNKPAAAAIRLISGTVAQIVTKEDIMEKMRFVFTLLAAGILAVVVCQGALAESGKPIARVLDPVSGYDEFTFKSAGNQILFAEIKSDIYQTRGRKGGSHETDEGDEGGCTDDHSDGGSTDTGTSGGCSHDTSDGTTDEGHDDCGGGGGAGDFCLQVLDPDGDKICWAGRPDRPGWQRDPRLACHIKEEYGKGEFTLLVFRGKCGGNPPTPAVTAAGETPVVYPYLLEVQLVDMASTGDLKETMAQSGGE